MSSDKILKVVSIAAGAVVTCLTSTALAKLFSDIKENKRRKKLDREHNLFEEKFKKSNGER